jgi:periplasmic protein TonB
MKKLFLLSLLSFLFVAPSFAQTEVEPIKYQPDLQPEFVGGMDALLVYMQENVVYPEAAKNAGVQGTIYVQFTIEKDGKVTEAMVMRGGDPALVTESLRVINNMPAWTAGQHEGKVVRTSMTLPVKFTL